MDTRNLLCSIAVYDDGTIEFTQSEGLMEISEADLQKILPGKTIKEVTTKGPVVFMKANPCIVIIGGRVYVKDPC